MSEPREATTNSQLKEQFTPLALFTQEIPSNCRGRVFYQNKTTSAKAKAPKANAIEKSKATPGFKRDIALVSQTPNGTDMSYHANAEPETYGNTAVLTLVEGGCFG